MQSGGTWTATILNNEIQQCLPDCTDCTATPIELHEAHDINDDGWIAAVGLIHFDDGPSQWSEWHAFLLVPFGDCPEDLHGDGDVDEDDLDIFLGYPGTGCEAGEICWVDVNGDCSVNSLDRRQIIEAYARAAARA